MNSLSAFPPRSLEFRVSSVVFALFFCASSASAQQARQPGQDGVSGLPPTPRPQLQLAQAAIPGLPSAPPAGASGLTWDQVKAKFEAANPVLKSDQANVDEMKA